MITLHETPDRTERATKLLDSLGANYQVHKFNKHPVAGYLGCKASHIALYDYALENNMDYIFILEDGFILKPNLKLSDFDHIYDYAQNNNDWAIINFGRKETILTPVGEDGFRRLNNFTRRIWPVTTLGYVINSRAIRKIPYSYRTSNDQPPIDRMLCKTFDHKNYKFLCTKNILLKRDDSPSLTASKLSTCVSNFLIKNMCHDFLCDHYGKVLLIIIGFMFVFLVLPYILVIYSAMKHPKIKQPK